MLYWNAQFQIPNSGVQAAEVFVLAEKANDVVSAKFYMDKSLNTLLFEKQYEANGLDAYEHLLSLDDFKQFTRV